MAKTKWPAWALTKCGRLHLWRPSVAYPTEAWSLCGLVRLTDSLRPSDNGDRCRRCEKTRDRSQTAALFIRWDGVLRRLADDVPVKRVIPAAPGRRPKP